jgi:hypothetical protein
MEWPLFIELIHYTKNALDSIKKYTELSRGRFIDKEFGEFFYRMITKEIEKNDLVMNSFLNYVKVTTPIRKKGTVNIFIEEVLKKYQVRLEESRIKISRHFEEDVPETIVPDEQLIFILDSILQYAMATMISDGNIEFLTKSSALRKETTEEAILGKDSKYLEILMVFTGYKRPAGMPTEEMKTPNPNEEFVSDVLLRLVEATVKMNQGVTKVEVDKTNAKKSVLLRLPVERRRVYFYESTSRNQRS